MVHFLSCDWGTSSFRLRLVNAHNAEVMAARKSDRGIAATYNSLPEEKKNDPQERLRFYLLQLAEYVRQIEEEKSISLAGVPLLVSGMASSSIGMAELPYRHLPFRTDGKDVEAAWFEASAAFAHPVLLISGVRSSADVMRGEETQLIGAVADGAAAEANGLYIFPGTHSKHIVVKDRQVTGFNTYMTGELFELLSKESILKAGVEPNDEWENPGLVQSFRNGVQEAKEANLLHSAFLVRTNSLFQKLTKKENYQYLSGLLIGTELAHLAGTDDARIYVCSDSDLGKRYETALQVLGLGTSRLVYSADEAVVRGQLKIYNHFSHT